MIKTDIQNNLNQLKKESNINHLKKFKFIAVIKANAYNHEAFLQAHNLNDEDITYLGIGRFEEGLLLRKKGVKSNLLLLGHNNKYQLPYIFENKITPVISNMEQLIELIRFTSNMSSPLKIWIKFDTGMRRLGFLKNESHEVIKIILKNPLIKITGIMTHLSNADNKQSLFSDIQLNVFLDILEKWKVNNLIPPYLSFSNSSALINYNSIFKAKTQNRLEALINEHPRTILLHRTGITLYGQSPSNDMCLTNKIKIIQNWKTKILQMKNNHIYIAKGSLDCIEYNWPNVKINKRFYPIKKIDTHYTIIDSLNENIPENSDVTLLSKKEAPNLKSISMRTQISAYELLNSIKNNSYQNQENLQDYQEINKKLSNSKIDIDANKIIHNYRLLKKYFLNQSVALNMEYNAYGIGQKQLLTIFKRNKIETIICQSLDEALKLRRELVNPIHCIECIENEKDIHLAIQNNIGISVYNNRQLDILKGLNKENKDKIIIYFVIGLNTNPGILNEGTENLSEFKNKNIFSYYIKDIGETIMLLTEFRKKTKDKFKYHIYNCENIKKIPEWITSIAHPYALMGCHKKFKQVLTWKCQISQVKFADKYDYISYGNTYQFEKKSKYAILPIGYADGFSNDPIQWPYVVRNKQKFKIIGKVCMDQSMILDEHQVLKRSQIITIIGKGISLEKISKQMNVSPLKVLSKISKRICRFIKN